VRRELFTAEEAAVEAGVEVATIYTWVRRGYLAAVGKRGRFNLYRLCDVFACEAARKRKHRRRPPIMFGFLLGGACIAEGFLHYIAALAVVVSGHVF
jgi:hypothetical protein